MVNLSLASVTNLKVLAGRFDGALVGEFFMRCVLTVCGFVQV